MKTTLLLNRYAVCGALLCTVAAAPSVAAQEFFVTVGKGALYRQTDAYTVRPAAVSIGFRRPQPYYFTAEIYGTAPDGAPKSFVHTPRGAWLPMESFAARSFAGQPGLDAEFPNGVYSVGWFYNGVQYQADLRVAGNAYPNTPYIVNWDWAHDIDTSVDFPLKFVPFADANPDDFIILEPFVSPAFPKPQIDPAATSITIPAGVLEPNQTVHLRLLFFRTTGLHVPAENPVVAGYGGYYRATYFTIRGGAPPPAQGRIQFGDDAYVVSENEGAIQIAVTRTGATEGNATVILSTIDGSANAGRDYVETTQTVFFDEGESVQLVTIPIDDNFRLRGDREFYVVLSDVTGGAEIRQPSRAVVTIKEDESAAFGEVYFSSASYSVSETDDFVRLEVRRSGDFTIAMTVGFGVESGTAHPWEDFAPEFGVVTFEEGQSEVELMIPILNDTDFERNETFQVQLANPSAGGSLGSPITATVTILSDDFPDLVSEYLTHNVGGRVNVTECRLSGGRATGVVEFQTQEGSRFVATGFLLLPQGRLMQIFRGRVSTDGRLSGSYSWRGNGDRGTGSFTGRFAVDAFLNPSIRLSFGGRSSIYGCRQTGHVASAAPPGEVAGEISSP